MDLQIKNHYDKHPTKVEMSLDKMLMVAIAIASPEAKGKVAEDVERVRKFAKDINVFCNSVLGECARPMAFESCRLG